MLCKIINWLRKLIMLKTFFNTIIGSLICTWYVVWSYSEKKYGNFLTCLSIIFIFLIHGIIALSIYAYLSLVFIISSETALSV